MGSVPELQEATKRYGAVNSNYSPKLMSITEVSEFEGD
jgi:hypothetical protein